MKGEIDRILTLLVCLCHIMAAIFAYLASDVVIDLSIPTQKESADHNHDKLAGFDAFRDKFICSGAISASAEKQHTLLTTAAFADDCKKVIARAKSVQTQKIILENDHAMYAMMSSILSILLMILRAWRRSKSIEPPPLPSNGLHEE